MFPVNSCVSLYQCLINDCLGYKSQRSKLFWLIAGSNRLAFSLEAGKTICIFGEFLRKYLNCNVASKLLVFGLVALSHAALAHLFQDPIMQNRLADLGHAFASR